MKLIHGILVFCWTTVASARLLGSAATFSMEEVLNLASGNEANVPAHDAPGAANNPPVSLEESFDLATDTSEKNGVERKLTCYYCDAYSAFAYHPDDYCVWYFRDCDCNQGYKKQDRNGYSQSTCCAAVSNWNAHEYNEQPAIDHCHSYSTFAHPIRGHDNKLGHTCYNDFHDCNCNHGYKKEDRNGYLQSTCCAAVSNWNAHEYNEQPAIDHCHSYSIFAHPIRGHDNKLGRACYNDFHDCVCKHPYFEDYHEQQCCSHDPHMFCRDMDEHNLAVPVAGCNKACNWHDCECPDGYKKHMEGTKCVPHDGPGSGGDPHFRSWTGSRFEFHGECDLVLLKAPLIDLDIQMRTTIRFDYSFISQVAIRLGQHVFEVASYGDYMLNSINTVDMPAQMGNHEVTMHQVNKKKHVFYVHMENQVDLEVTSFKDYVSISVLNSTAAMFEGAVGLLGNHSTGDVLSRDGTSIMSLEEEAAYLIGEEWQVRPDVDGQLFSFVRAPQFPTKCVFPDATAFHARARKLGEASVSHDEAETACTGVGSSIKDDCINDVLKTGDIDIAQVY